jgi:hypothetical protein
MTSVGAVGSADVAQSLAGRTVSTAREPPGNCFSSSASGAVRLIQATQSFGCSTATWRSWYGATSGPGAVSDSTACRSAPARAHQASSYFSRTLIFPASMTISAYSSGGGSSSAATLLIRSIPIADHS